MCWSGRRGICGSLRGSWRSSRSRGCSGPSPPRMRKTTPRRRRARSRAPLATDHRAGQVIDVAPRDRASFPGGVIDLATVGSHIGFEPRVVLPCVLRHRHRSHFVVPSVACSRQFGARRRAEFFRRRRGGRDLGSDVVVYRNPPEQKRDGCERCQNHSDRLQWREVGVRLPPGMGRKLRSLLLAEYAHRPTTVHHSPARWAVLQALCHPVTSALLNADSLRQATA